MQIIYPTLSTHDIIPLLYSLVSAGCVCPHLQSKVLAGGMIIYPCTYVGIASWKLRLYARGKLRETDTTVA